MNTILLQADAMNGGAGWANFIMIILIIAIFYFFMIRPQSQRQKAIQKFRDSLMVGDQVMTSGGVYGKVKEIKDTYVLVEIANSVNIKVDKSCLFQDATAIAPTNNQQ